MYFNRIVHEITNPTINFPTKIRFRQTSPTFLVPTSRRLCSLTQGSASSNNRARQMTSFLLFSFLPQFSNHFDQHNVFFDQHIKCSARRASLISRRFWNSLWISSRRPHSLLDCLSARCCTCSRSFTCMASTACSSICSTTWSSGIPCTTTCSWTVGTDTQAFWSTVRWTRSCGMFSKFCFCIRSTTWVPGISCTFLCCRTVGNDTRAFCPSVRWSRFCGTGSTICFCIRFTTWVPRISCTFPCCRTVGTDISVTASWIWWNEGKIVESDTADGAMCSITGVGMRSITGAGVVYTSTGATVAARGAASGTDIHTFCTTVLWSSSCGMVSALCFCIRSTTWTPGIPCAITCSWTVGTDTHALSTVRWSRSCGTVSTICSCIRSTTWIPGISCTFLFCRTVGNDTHAFCSPERWPRFCGTGSTICFCIRSTTWEPKISCTCRTVGTDIHTFCSMACCSHSCGMVSSFCFCIRSTTWVLGISCTFICSQTWRAGSVATVLAESLLTSWVQYWAILTICFIRSPLPWWNQQCGRQHWLPKRHIRFL